MTNEFVDVRQLPGTTITKAARDQGYFPVIATPDGRQCLVAMRAGAGHVGLGGRLVLLRSADGGRTWEEPRTIVDSERDDRNPAWGFARDGTLVLAYHWQGSYDEESRWAPDLERVQTKTILSRDQGQTWREESLLNFTALDGASPFGKIRSDADGALYMPIYGRTVPGNFSGYVEVEPAKTRTYLLRSRDDGRTWGEPVQVALGLNEGDLLFLPEGDLLYVARSEAGAALYACRSSDGGRTWGDLQQVTRDREHPPDLTLLGNGYILLLFGCRNAPYGVQGLISRDGGRTWDDRRLLLADDLPGQDIGYPSTARLEDGRLVTVFYSAGTEDNPHDTHNAVHVFCRAICYDEDVLLAAWDI